MRSSYSLQISFTLTTFKYNHLHLQPSKIFIYPSNIFLFTLTSIKYVHLQLYLQLSTISIYTYIHMTWGSRDQRSFTYNSEKHLHVYDFEKHVIKHCMIKAQGTVETVEMLQLENQNYRVRPPKKNFLLRGDLSVRGPFTLCTTDDRRGDNRRGQFQKVVVKEGWSPIRGMFHHAYRTHITHHHCKQTHHTLHRSEHQHTFILYTNPSLTHFTQIKALLI